MTYKLIYYNCNYKYNLLRKRMQSQIFIYITNKLNKSSRAHNSLEIKVNLMLKVKLNHNDLKLNISFQFKYYFLLLVTLILKFNQVKLFRLQIFTITKLKIL